MGKIYFVIFIILGFPVKSNGQATLSVNPTSLDFGSVCINTAPIQSFTINGTNLTNETISVGPLPGYSFSATSGGTYLNSLSLTQTGGTYSQQVYVKFAPSAAQSYDGSISISGGGATPISVSVTGSGLATQPASV